MLDLELLIYSLLSRSVPDFKIMPEHEVGEIDDFPLCIFTITGGAMLDGTAGRPLAWDAQLSLSVFDTTLDLARTKAGLFYDAVWSWDDPWSGAGIIDELGHATEITDESLFSRVGTVDIGDGRSVTQYDGRFGLQLHSA